jgi:hypothetical protein
MLDHAMWHPKKFTWHVNWIFAKINSNQYLGRYVGKSIRLSGLVGRIRWVGKPKIR